MKFYVKPQIEVESFDVKENVALDLGQTGETLKSIPGMWE